MTLQSLFHVLAIIAFMVTIFGTFTLVIIWYVKWRKPSEKIPPDLTVGVIIAGGFMFFLGAESALAPWSVGPALIPMPMVLSILVAVCGIAVVFSTMFFGDNDETTIKSYFPHTHMIRKPRVEEKRVSQDKP